MAANTDIGKLLYWRHGAPANELYKNNNRGAALFWVRGAQDDISYPLDIFHQGPFLFAIVGQPYVLRVQGIPGMRSFSQMGHGGL